ncbi:MAG TPA: alpha-2-macroglobulin family protein [Puia sp.]|nr:alpha-2-macroglobulin family protein [Puia sp.]
MNLQEQKWEDAAKINIDDLHKEIRSANEPVKSILESILAEIYWHYFQQNRWNLYDRTKTVNFTKEDIATWSIDDFHKKITELYLASVHNEYVLTQTKLERFDPIIVKGNARYLRPTLFDLLAHRALEYFKNDESDFTRPAYMFEIDHAEVFANKSVFAQYHFTSPDSSSCHFIALKLFQQLILFHLKDEKPDALIDADIERIQFASQYAVLENKDELYSTALENITVQYGNESAAAQAWYLQADQYANKAAEYDASKDTANRYAYLKAKSICEKVIQQKDSSEGKSNCESLLRTILGKDLNLQTEKVNVPGEPFRTLVSYRNITQLYFRIIKLEHQQKLNLTNIQWNGNYWNNLMDLPVTRAFSQSFPETGDYQLHRAEIKIDSLAFGEYALLASVDPNFNMQKNLMAVEYFYVSNIAYINNGLDYFVLNRESGQPLARANVQFWYPYFDQQQKKYIERKGENIITDKNGSFQVNPPKTKNNNSFSIELTSTDDHLFLNDEMQSNSYRDDPDNAADKASYEQENLKTFFFTDRSVYRPGQTVYFKGLVLTKDFVSHRSKTLPQFKTKVILYDANEQKVDSVSVTTNDFGSYNGKFKLPENLLNGEFSIADDSTANDQTFSVEEYKRPKFYVAFEKLKGTYHLNDSIKITGSATAYAGNNIDGANVKYRVVRQARYPYPWLYSRWGSPHGSSQEIIHGEMKTGADGKFSISFRAMPDKAIKKELEPVFEYAVTADVTDINGETRSGETQVPIGYKALNLSIDLPQGDNIPAGSLKNIIIKTENLWGEFEPAKVDVAIYKLRSPYRLIRERYWQRPDQFVMSREEYLKYFPTDEYNNEAQKETWEKTDKVFETTDSSKNSALFNINHSPFTSGWYLIEATSKDKYGEDVRNIKYIQLYDPKSNMPANPQYNWISDNEQSVQPGSRAITNIGTSANNVFVIEQEKRTEVRSRMRAMEDTTEQYHFILLSNEKKSQEVPITESDRGGIGVTYVFVKDNRFYSGNNIIDVPWTNKELNISYETYRDKTLPGSEEKWRVKVSGNKKEKIAAEVLSAMYDASLDQFKPQGWSKPDIYFNYHSENNWNANNNFIEIESQGKDLEDDTNYFFQITYDRLLSAPMNMRVLRIRGISSVPQTLNGKASGVLISNSEKNLGQAGIYGFSAQNKRDITGAVEMVKFTPPKIVKDEEAAQEQKPPGNEQPEVRIRKDFSETAFFFPDLQTDSSGSVEFSFTMPEAITQWKWMTFAHTKDLAFGYSEKNIITQKQLMVEPNLPRFLREGDKIELSAKIVNLTDSEMTGQTELQLFDATTNEPVDGLFINREANQYFTAEAKQSVPVNFSIDVPYQFNKPITYRIIARSNNMSDGEEAPLPILSNSVLVTESLPLNIHGAGTKNFKFEKLLQSGNSETLNHHALTVEYTANPAWYAVQALPYLMQYPYECAEQTFNRFYANALASKIVSANPKIKQVFEKWSTTDTSALLSSLQKNQELKSVLLEETPWVVQAKNESAQKKNLGFLFDMIRMHGELQSALNKLTEMQLADGGFTWFKGGDDDRYISQYIVAGIGHLKKMNALPEWASEKIGHFLSNAIAYLDSKIRADQDELIKSRSNLADDQLADIQIQYLYLRSFFPEYPIPGETFKAMNYYRKQSQQFWLRQNKYMQAMIALSLFRTGDIKTAKDILTSLKQNAIVSEDMGMYWKENTAGYYWYQSPVETQSLLIEAFAEITNDAASVGHMKTWLLNQKQTQNWETTKATADACYAMLLQGAGLLTGESNIQVRLGSTLISSDENKTEAGTGYFKKTIDGNFVKPGMGNITVTNSSNPPGRGASEKGASWGAVYWQYFENLDKITPSATPLRLIKKLFIEKNTDRGPVLQPVEENATLKIGDKVKVRIELRADRDMEYVHMKDMRASCMEPANVLSEYKWEGGLGYYETTKDASTNFFFGKLPRGTYVFEYPLLVTAAGNFSNGITTIECMYAPAYTSHSEGFRINVE